MTKPTNYELLKLLAKLMLFVAYEYAVNIKNWLLSYLSKMFRAV